MAQEKTKNAVEKLQTTSDCSLSTPHLFVLINSIYCSHFLGALNYKPSISWRKTQTHRFFFYFPQIPPRKCVRLRNTKGSFEATSEMEIQSAV